MQEYSIKEIQEKIKLSYDAQLSHTAIIKRLKSDPLLIENKNYRRMNGRFYLINEAGLEVILNYYSHKFPV